MTLAAIYRDRTAAALEAAVPAAALAAAWHASHPPQHDGHQDEPTAAGLAVAAAFLAAAGTEAAIAAALLAVLPGLWAEGWLLGQASAQSLVTGEEADWRGWTPGDATAAQAQASAGLGAFLAGQSGVADGIAATYADRMAAVLASAEGLDPDELTANLRDALASEHAAGVIAHTEMSRAQFRAAGDIYRADGIAFIDVITAEDDRVCAVCEGLQDANPHDIRSFGVDDLLPAHPFCRCVAVPAVQSAARNSLLRGRVMAGQLRRVLSDGYVPVAIGRDRGLRSQAAAVDAAPAEPDLDAAQVVQHQQHRGRTSDAGLDL